VDRYRTIPLFYSTINEKIIISENTEHILPLVPYKIDAEALLEFRMAGYTLTKKTLLRDVFQVLAGEYLEIRNNNLETIRYFNYGFHFKNQTEEQFSEELNTVIENVFNRYVESLNGRRVFIPLSAGLDSRLILSLFRKFEYDNIITYTYGIKGLWEIERAKKIAKTLKYPWYQLEYNSRTRLLFSTPDREKYFRFSTNHSSIGQIPEFYGLINLKNQVAIDGSEVFINGQSGDFTTGGHIPAIVDQSKYLPIEELVNIIIKKHFSLWTNLNTAENNSSIRRTLLDILDKDEYTILNSEEFSDLFERFEWQERQSKYVINGVRAYDWYGLEWRLPLWDNEFVDFWLTVPWQLRYKQRLYKRTLDERNYSNVFNKEFLPRPDSYSPILIKPLRIIALLSQPLFGEKIVRCVNDYTRIFMNYAPFYPQPNYFKFAKECRHHRNTVSFWTKYYLAENDIHIAN
jgi:asparagine synthase (glutamine-hydrolysing)